MAPTGWGRERWLVGGIQSPLSLTTRSRAGAILDPQGCTLGLCGVFMCTQLPVCACALGGSEDKHSCHSQPHHLVFGDSLLLAWSSSSRLGWQASPREPPVSPPSSGITRVCPHTWLVFSHFYFELCVCVSKSLCT